MRPGPPGNILDKKNLIQYNWLCAVSGAPGEVLKWLKRLPC